MIKLLLQSLLYRSPQIEFETDEEQQYERLLESMIHERSGVFEYTLPYPKYRFLYYVSMKEEFVFHGSNNHSIETFEPRKQTLFNGTLTESVFATIDAIWPIFYAVFQRSSLVGSFRNGCLIYKGHRYHCYSLNESTMKNNPWTEGMLYILPKQTFSISDYGKVQFDEWISHEPVKPVGKLVVTSEDFFYSDKVSTHKDGESLFRTWMLYKIRTLWSRS